MQDSKRMDSFKGITFKKDYKDFISKIHSARKNNVLSTDLVTTDYVEIGFDDIDDTIGAGKYHMFYDGVEFRFFINPVRSEHLYVFLNG
ncbi:MAG: hypothetical protein MJZ68_09850, partial [archaeon]|nr:hypothetical protein [archaeon]